MLAVALVVAAEVVVVVTIIESSWLGSNPGFLENRDPIRAHHPNFVIEFERNAMISPLVVISKNVTYRNRYLADDAILARFKWNLIENRRFFQTIRGLFCTMPTIIVATITSRGCFDISQRRGGRGNDSPLLPFLSFFFLLLLFSFFFPFSPLLLLPSTSWNNDRYYSRLIAVLSIKTEL